MRSAQQRDVLGVVRCRTVQSSRMCTPAPPVQIFFARGINVAYTRFKVDKDIMDALVNLRKKTRAGGAGGGQPPESQPWLASLWDMLYADDFGVVSQPPEQLRKMMGVVVAMCMAFGLTVSETKTEIMCLRTKGVPDATAIFSVGAVGQVYDKTKEFVYLGGNVNYHVDLSI